MSTRDLTQGPVPQKLFALTAPLMIGISSNIIVGMLEIGFIGQLGTQQVAAITFTFPVTMMLTSIAFGISIGTSSVIARSVGSGGHDDVKQLATHSILLVLVSMTVLSIVGWSTIDPVFVALGAGPKLLPMIHSYLDIYYPSTILFTLTMVAGNVMRANGEARIPGVVMTLGALANLALDPLFIFGLLGLPRMELAGAALASVISRIGTAAALLYYVYNADLVSTHNVGARFLTSTRRILAVGLPAIATQLIGPVSGALITRLLASHGEVVVAGFGVATRIESVAIMLFFALSGSIGPFVGQNWGANRVDRVKQSMRVSYQFCLVWGCFVAIALLAAGGTIVAWVDDSPEVVTAAVYYLAVVPWSYGFWGLLMMASASFNALGKPIPPTVLAFTRMFVVYIPLAMLLDHLLGYRGIFIATGLSNMVMGIAGVVWFRQRPPRTPVAIKTG